MDNKKGLKKGFLKNGVFKPNSSSSASFEAKKLHFISEMQRISRIHDEYMKIRQARNQTNDLDFDFVDDREREAFETFQVLMGNAGLELLADPDVIKAIQQTDQEEIDHVKIDNLGMRDDKIEKKGSKVEKKGVLEKGFLKNGVFRAKDFEAFRQATNQIDDLAFEFLDDREREAFEHVLMENADFELLEDPDVIKAIEETDQELMEEEIDDEQIEKLGIRDDKMEKKGYKKGFLKNLVFRGKASSSSSTSSYEVKKRNFISELQRLLSIRNECRKIREASKNYLDCIDDREREAFETFNDLMSNADWDLLEDPDVIQVIEQKDCELEIEIAGLQVEECSKRARKAKVEFVEGLKVGREVRIVGGSDIGKKGKVLEVREEDDSVALRFLNGEEMVVSVGNVAYLGSTAEDMCLMKLIEMKSKGKEAEDMCLRKLRSLEIKNSGGFGRNKFY